MNSQLTSLPMCGFIAQLVEHRTGIAEVTGSNPVEALIFFQASIFHCLNWKFTAKITYHLQVSVNYPRFRTFLLIPYSSLSGIQIKEVYPTFGDLF